MPSAVCIPSRRFLCNALGILTSVLFVLASGFVQADDAPPPPKPKLVPSILIKKDKLSGDDPHLPDPVKAQHAGGVVTGSYKVCIGSEGTIASVEVRQGIEGADAAIIATLKTWRYKPQPIPICFIQLFEFHIEGGSAPGPSSPAAPATPSLDGAWIGSGSAPPATLEAALPLVPNKLMVNVYSHVIYDDKQKAIPCSTLVTDGLSAHKQKELAITIFRTPEFFEQIKPLLLLFKNIYALSAEGRLVDAGDRTTLKLLLLGAFKAILYAPFETIPGIPRDRERLAMLLLHPVEIASVEAIGGNRFLTHLGQRYRYFPHPFWNDPARTPVLSAADLEQSVLSKLPTQHVRGAFANREGDALKLTLLPAARLALLEQLRQQPQVLPALMLDFDEEARARLVWSAGQRTLQGIAAPGGGTTRLGGAFLVIVPQAKTDGGGIIEDGFTQQMTAASWDRFREALTRGQPLSLPASAAGMMRFELVLMQTEYHNPVDGTTLAAPGGFRSYGPQQQAARCGPIEPKKIVLLTDQNLIASRMQMKDLVDVFVAINEAVLGVRTVAGVLPASGSPRELIVDFTLRGDRPNLPNLHEERATPPFSSAVNQLLERRLSAIATPPISGGEVHFQLFYELRPARDGEQSCSAMPSK